MFDMQLSTIIAVSLLSLEGFEWYRDTTEVEDG